MTTPNTPANGGQILTWQERCDWGSDEPAVKLAVDAMKAEIRDLRASLAAPAIPTVDRNAEAAEDFASWLAREMPPGTVIASPAWWAPRILSYARIALRAAGVSLHIRPRDDLAMMRGLLSGVQGVISDLPRSEERTRLIGLHKLLEEVVAALPPQAPSTSAPAAQPAAPVVLTEDEQLALMSTVEDYMGAVDWARTQTHAKCDAAEAAIFAKVNEIISCRATALGQIADDPMNSPASGAAAQVAVPQGEDNRIMRQALIDMQNPITAMQREVPEGSALNPHIAMQMASEPEWYKCHAQEALDKCATPATVKTAEGL